MILDVNARDLQTWKELASEMGAQLRYDVNHTNIGGILEEKLREQTELITSLPREAAERVQRITREALFNGKRSSELIAEIQASGAVAYSRAKLIARTEVAKTASNLVEARARDIGSTHYVWRTARDADVRPGHKKMEGKVCEWANPPAVEENDTLMHHHPGQIWNCRCWAEPILPDRL
jgi:SPP1 gp7 family putative phage head morphogenesis protein